MKEPTALFVTGLFMGLGPCLAFCGPILFPYIAGRKRSWLGGAERYSDLLYLSSSDIWTLRPIGEQHQLFLSRGDIFSKVESYKVSWGWNICASLRNNHDAWQHEASFLSYSPSGDD